VRRLTFGNPPDGREMRNSSERQLPTPGERAGSL
jgi:hypothetical protein